MVMSVHPDFYSHNLEKYMECSCAGKSVMIANFTINVFAKNEEIEDSAGKRL